MSDFDQIIDDGVYYRHWPAETETRGVVLLVHGLGEHCERYTELAAYLNRNGYAICSMDLPGHGQSMGRRGHIAAFSDYQDAVLTLHAKIRTLYPDTNVYLLGHSMGGLISTRFLLDHQSLFKGAILSGAAIESPQPPPALQVKLVNFLARMIPTMEVIKLDASGVSRDPDVVKAYLEDPLVHKGKMSARLISELFSTMQECQARANEIALPILIMHGSADTLTAPAGSQLLHDQVSSSDKTLKIYDGLYHEIFNEPEAPQIYGEVINWLNQRR